MVSGLKEKWLLLERNLSTRDDFIKTGVDALRNNLTNGKYYICADFSPADLRTFTGIITRIQINEKRCMVYIGATDNANNGFADQTSPHTYVIYVRMKELESIGRLWAEFAVKNNLDPKHVDVSKLKETNPQAYTQFNEIVDLDGIMFNFSNPNWHTVYHELAHIFDYEQKNMNGYEHKKDWNKRSHEVTAEVSALVRMLSNEFGSKEQLEAEWPNTRVGYDNIINTYLHGEMQLADRKNLLKKLFQVRDHLLKTLA